MASTYSGNLAIELIGTGDQAGTWGNTTNTNLGTSLEQAIVGSSDITFSSANVALALTQSNAWQAARSLRLNLIGTVVNAQYLYVPAVSKQYIIKNNLSNSVIVSNGSNAASVGNTVTVPAGKTVVVYNTGSNIAETTSYISDVSIGTASITNASISTANITNINAGNVSANNMVLVTALPATSGGTGQNTFAVGDLLVGAAGNSLTKVTIGAANTVLTSNGTTAYWANVASGGSGFLTWAAVQSTNFNASVGTAYPVNTAAGNVTVLMPSAPSYGQMVLITDYASTFGLNACVINPNGSKLLGNTSNQTMSVSRTALGLVYTDTNRGWIQFSTADTDYAGMYQVSGLLVGGGGAGGGNGGGGAGGFVEFSNASVISGVIYTATVGAGGTFNSSTGLGTNGGNTSFTGTGIGLTVAIGGGGGDGATPGNGGSGGGAGGTAGTGGSGTTGQGFPGGNCGATYSGSPGAGGGGATATANAVTTNRSSTGGGAGKTWTVDSVAYAGGGGGGAFNGNASSGGAGGGGNGGTTGTPGNAGTNGLGGGGGGGYCQGNNGRNGGSGVAIIYYSGPPRGSGGNVTSSGGFTFHTFTSTGGYIA